MRFVSSAKPKDSFSLQRLAALRLDHYCYFHGPMGGDLAMPHLSSILYNRLRKVSF